VKLQGEYERFKALNAEIVAISVEKLGASARLAENKGIEYPILADPEHQVIEAYGVYNLLGDGRASPSVFVVDEEGIIVWKHVGEKRDDWPATDAILEQLG